MGGSASPGKAHQAKGRDRESMNKSQIHQKSRKPNILHTRWIWVNKRK